MIQSILDNDQYKFTMQQAILKLGFAATPVKYKFKCRTPNIDFTRAYHLILYNLAQLPHLRLGNNELQYMKSLPYFSDEYLEFLKQFRFDMGYVNLKVIDNGELDLTIEGPWFHTILFETPMLAIVSNSYAEVMAPNDSRGEAIERLENKTTDLPLDFKFAELGTRRRRDFLFHRYVVERCKTKCPRNFLGTSNMLLSMICDVKAVGTMAHEWLQAHQQLGYRLIDSQKMAFENWIKVYRGNLGIALSDVINTDAFLKDFDDPFLYKLFDGVREDSEPEPLQFAKRMIDFYYKRNIKPTLKTIVFSNGLDMKKALNIFYTTYGFIGSSYGIGTNLTNDWETPPLNIVIKMVECNHQPVAKISNSPSKNMCENDDFVKYLKHVYEVE